MLDADLGQRANRVWMDVARRFCSGGNRLPFVPQPRVDDGLSHLRAGGIARAQEEDFALHARGVSRSRALTIQVVTSAWLGMRPALTSCSLITRPGVPSR